MKDDFRTVSVIGLGYIGLPTAATLASRGINVVGVDINTEVIKKINLGQVHIVEPELDAVVQTVVASGKLRATSHPEPADAFIITVPTPFKSGFEPDLCYVEAAARSIAPVLAKNNLVILESTSPVGTTEMISQWFAEARPDLLFPHQVGNDAHVQIAYCPERVLPGCVLRELVENDRTIGGLSRKCSLRAIALYKTFVRGECLPVDSRMAEMTKLTENAFRDVNIAFANELSLICDRLNINVWELIELANRHPRVKVLQPGPGVGGHCIAVDPWFIVSSTPDQVRLIRTAREVNDSKPKFVLGKIREQLAARKNPVVACLGLSFKANIDDLRESPALSIVESLAAEESSAVILVVEPHISKLPASLAKHSRVQLVPLEVALERADTVVVLVNHRAFSEAHPESLNGKRVLDFSGISGKAAAFRNDRVPAQASEPELLQPPRIPERPMGHDLGLN